MSRVRDPQDVPFVSIGRSCDIEVPREWAKHAAEEWRKSKHLAKYDTYDGEDGVIPRFFEGE